MKGVKIDFSKEETNKIIELHFDGLTNQEIADRYNVSRMTIGRLLHKNNIESRHPWLNEERINKAISLYLEGKTQNEISEILHMNGSTIKRILLDNNIDQRSMSEIKSKYTLKTNYFHNIDSHDKAYFLGLLYSDGNLSKSSYNFALSLQESDKHIIEEFNECLGSNRPLGFIELSKKNKNYKNQYSLNVTNKEMYEDLLQLGLHPNKSLDLVFPDFLDEEYYPSFLLGIMDGDGSILKKEKRCSFLSTEDFCMKAKDIIESKLGIHCQISLCHGNDKVSTRTLRISGGKQVKKFLDWIYSKSNHHINRKYEIYKELYCS